MCFVHLAVLGVQHVEALYRAHTSCLQKGAFKQNHHHQLLLQYLSAVPAQRGIAVALTRRLLATGVVLRLVRVLELVPLGVVEPPGRGHRRLSSGGVVHCLGHFVPESRPVHSMRIARHW
jgi:hypothetical protein